MSAQPKPDMTADEFLAWSAGLPGDGAKLELIDGIVMQQQSERVIHSELKLKTANALRIDPPGLAIAVGDAFEPE